MKYLAIIPARGGSKGVPGKNVRNVGGQPLLAWSIQQARDASKVDRVIVSTDSEEIARVAESHGGEVPFRRPAAISGDTATTESAMLHAIAELASTGYKPDCVVLLQATSPLRKQGAIDAAIDLFEQGGNDSLVSVCASHALFWRNPGAPQALYDYQHRPRRQDISPAEREYRENGSIYVTRTDRLMAAENRLVGKVAMFEMSEEESWEVDSEADLVVVDALLRHFLPFRDLCLKGRAIALAVFDFDGVLTDNRVLVNGDGVEAVYCNRSDGWAFGRLRAAGIPTLILSTERNPVVGVRGKKLGVPVLQAAADKAEAIASFTRENGISLDRTLYVGNDLNDLPAMRTVGWPVAVADAHEAVRAQARIVLSRAGGEGIVAEIADAILGAR